MFDFIQGKVDYVCPEYIVIENQGIGYQIITPNPFVYAGKLHTEVKVYIYHYMRAEMMALYGFSSRAEKMMFEKLLTVSGIGPKGALGILSAGSPEQIVQAIENEDEAFLRRFPGVGKKTARQMILDLKGKLKDVIAGISPEKWQVAAAETVAGGNDRELEEALLALKTLGYTDKEIHTVLPELKKEQMTTEQYIKKALRTLAK